MALYMLKLIRLMRIPGQTRKLKQNIVNYERLGILGLDRVPYVCKTPNTFWEIFLGISSVISNLMPNTWMQNREHGT